MSRLASTNSSWSPQSPSVAGSTPSVDWYVGYVEAKDDVWVFTLNLATRDATDLPLRIQIAKDALQTVKALPPK